MNLLWRPRVCCHFLFGKETINVCVLTIINVLICSYFIFTLTIHHYTTIWTMDPTESILTGCPKKFSVIMMN